jgi:hypothetical protein
MKTATITIGLCIVIAGCASVVSSRYQNIHVSPKCGDIPVNGVCDLRNDNGAWTINAPANIVIQKAFGDLSVTCHGAKFDPHVAYIPSKASIATFGNLILGGPLGVAVDTKNGAGYKYPDVISFNLPSCKSK